MLKVQNVFKSYPKEASLFGKDKLQVLSRVDFELKKGQCLGLIGESGSGKSTLARLIMDLEKLDKGLITIEGEKIKDWKKKNLGQISIVFQDYTSSVNPRFTVKKIIEEPMVANRKIKDTKDEIIKLLDKVGLSSQILHRHPHELSGGQLQRVCIARAISTNPKIIILDEAISSLDVPVQTKILDLLKELKDDLNLTYLFITHDIQAVAYISDRVLVLHKGNIVEKCKVSELASSENLYVRKLLDSVIAFEL